jgi:subtilase family serine protease
VVQWWPGENYRGPARAWLVDYLPPHSSKTLTAVYRGYPSWYSRLITKVVVDSRNTVLELNESNNEMRMKIRVAKP